MTRLTLFLAAASLSLTACGSSNGVDPGATPTTTLATPATSTPTAAGVAVNATAFKNVFYGKTTGAQFAFNLSGFDSAGTAWTGSYTVIADGANFQTVSAVPSASGLPLFRSRSLATLQQSGGMPSSSSSTKYYLASDCSFYSFTDSSNISYVPVQQPVPLPDSLRVGDLGSLASLKQTSKTEPNTIDVMWNLTPGVNGGSDLVITSNLQKPSVGVDTEVDCFTLDANGIPTALSVHLINRFLTTVVLDLTLAGPVDPLVKTIF